jgi:glycogen operon protein
MPTDLQPGSAFPIGATLRPGGVNFSVYADKADAVELLLFDGVDDARPAQVFRLDARRHRTYHYWHAFVPGVQAGQIYAYRALGPNEPQRGLCYDAEKVLLDPYGRCVAMPAAYSRGAAGRPGDNAATAMKSVVVDSAGYDWEGDQPLRRPIPQTVIYEMHVAGFTRHPSSGVAQGKRGTYAGLVEVILDVVYNHTAEAFGAGATLSFRGLANDVYYVLDPADKSRYADYTGCGNTLNAGHAVVRRLICDSLRYWVQEMHVDGFRFDLASVLTRDEHGAPLPNPPVIWDIETDPALAGIKLFAEAWDAAGLYQVGSFVGNAWLEWNGRFRDDVRRFVKSDNGAVVALARRLAGSPDLYGKDAREPEQSVNFITVHDGFTLNDLVSYNEKHNEANGEANRDGSNDNFSWNCGVEGPTDDPAVEALRNRQVKNFFTLLLTAVGAPLIQMGDEVRRTQHGNNNTYCQDNELSWFDWTLLDRHADVHRFVKQLIADRLDFGRGRTADDRLDELLQRVKIGFHGVDGAAPDVSRTSHALAMSRTSYSGKDAFYVMVNAYWEPLDFVLPAAPATTQGWRLWINTSRPSPGDIIPRADAPPVVENLYRVGPRAAVALVATEAGG